MYICCVDCVCWLFAGGSGPQFIAVFYNVSILLPTNPSQQQLIISSSLSLSLCRLKEISVRSILTVVLLSLLLATPAVIIWLCLVKVPVRVAVLCREGCECDRAGCEAFCENTSFTAVP
jgi:hypothetical protein